MTTLIETIETGNFNKLGKPERIIETLISKLFFFGDDVYKVYKYNKAFFGDFSDDRLDMSSITMILHGITPWHLISILSSDM